MFFMVLNFFSFQNSSCFQKHRCDPDLLFSTRKHQHSRTAIPAQPIGRSGAVSGKNRRLFYNAGNKIITLSCFFFNGFRAEGRISTFPTDSIRLFSHSQGTCTECARKAHGRFIHRPPLPDGGQKSVILANCKDAGEYKMTTFGVTYSSRLS